MSPEERENAREIARMHADAHMNSIKSANRKLLKWTAIISVFLLGSCALLISS